MTMLNLKTFVTVTSLLVITICFVPGIVFRVLERFVFDKPEDQLAKLDARRAALELEVN
jgi:hypothetical protein